MCNPFDLRDGGANTTPIKPEGRELQKLWTGKAEQQAMALLDEKYTVARWWTLSFLGLPVSVTILLSLTGLIDVNTVTENSVNLLWSSLANPSPEKAATLIFSLAFIHTVILGFIVTVTIIILQIAAYRFTSRVTRLFMSDFRLMVCLTLFVSSTVYVMGSAMLIGPIFESTAEIRPVSRTSFIVCCIVSTLDVLTVFPYLAYMFEFLDASRIFGRIADLGLSAAIEGNHTKTNINVKIEHVIQAQNAVVQAIDQIADFGLCSLRDQDQYNAFQAIDLLAQFVVVYGHTKQQLSIEWFDIKALHSRPDFISLSDNAIRDMNLNSTWLEWKVLRDRKSVV